ncbi:hypothetical protein G6F64_013967 [Rhizopus arrhizus]|uniref:Uncharacterized protein n=1 Tax=Rhizopus oryzae TaxID=64495 RepID=A0A9P7BK14_RHIOR|nr:hypothetical protein G6F64_013967 [Rhizopus arrhizus]
MLERLVHIGGQFVGLQLRVLADDGADQLADELGVSQLVAVDEADDLAGAGHAVLPHHVVEVRETGIEVDAFQDRGLDQRLQQRLGGLLAHEVVIRAHDGRIALDDGRMGARQLEHAVLVRQVGDRGQHIAVALVVDHLLLADDCRVGVRGRIAWRAGR